MSTDLTQAMTLILLMLYREPLHGYAIMIGIPRVTHDDYEVSAGTLYRSVAEMVAVGLIEEANELMDAAVDERRKYYRITQQGRLALTAEMRRLSHLVELARLTESELATP